MRDPRNLTDEGNDTMNAKDRQQIEAAAEQTWVASADTRSEFGENKAAFMAYSVASARGAVRSVIDRAGGKPPESSFVDMHAVEAAAEQAWASLPDVRAEFDGNKRAFMAFRKAAANGQVKLWSAEVDSQSTPTAHENRRSHIVSSGSKVHASVAAEDHPNPELDSRADATWEKSTSVRNLYFTQENFRRVTRRMNGSNLF